MASSKTDHIETIEFSIATFDYQRAGDVLGQLRSMLNYWRAMRRIHDYDIIFVMIEHGHVQEKGDQPGRNMN